ncbi:hypothetical protein B1B_01221 [mine drainage metagenome]|uniref:Uncharacterized protein n=1 Tax=mine drainage metagenome TaxID=410659 RepID=T1C584_9ZZZZ
MPASKPTPPSEVPEPAPSADGASLGERIASELELLVRNVDVLQRLSGKSPIGIIRLSEALNLPIHKVRYSLHLLEREGVFNRRPTERWSPTKPYSTGNRSAPRWIG